LKEMGENYANTMNLDKGTHFGKLNTERHERDLKLAMELKQQMENEMEALTNNKDKNNAAFMAMTDLQTMISEAQRYRDEIESYHVKL